MVKSNHSNYHLNLLGRFFVSLLLFATVTAQAAVPKIVLDMEGNLDDSSGNSLVTLSHGGVSFVSEGVSGQALSLDGSTGYLELPYDLLAGSSDFTVDFWFKTTTRGGLLGYQRTAYPTAPSTFVPIIAVESDGHLRTEMWSTYNGAQNGVSISSTNVVNDGVWHRVVLTADATNESYNVYLDGALLGAADAEILHLEMSFNQLGVVRGTGTAGRSQLVQGWDFFDGEIDQFVLYAEAVPASEVAKTAQFITFAAPADQPQSNQSAQLAGSSDSGLTLSYASTTASECSVSGVTVQLLSVGTCTIAASQDGDATYSAASPVTRSFEITEAPIAAKIALDMEGNLDDSSGNGLITLAHGGASFVAGGVSGQALSLDGTGYLELPYDLIAGGTNFTIDLWFKTTARGGLLGYQQTAYPTVPDIFIPIIAVTGDGHLRTEMWSTANGQVISSPNIVNDGAWHRVVLTADLSSQSYNVYLDGTSLGTVNAEIVHQGSFNQLGVVHGTGSASRETTLVQDWDYFNGQIDQFVLYGDAIPASEVSKTAQFISFSALADQPLSAQSIQLNASSSAALQVSYSSSTTSVCSVDGVTLQLLSGGMCSVTASQSGDITYSSASPVTRSFDITSLSTMTVPPDVAVDATALFSRVELGEATAMDTSGQAIQATTNTNQLFRPGRHTVTWRAVDSLGVAVEDTQQVDVRPLVSFQDGQTTGEGKTLQVRVVLNGESPVYPLTIPYTVSGSASASDHTAVDGQLVIASGTNGYIEVEILSDSVAENPETIVLSLVDNADINPGAKSQHTITISEENIAPAISLQVQQNNEDRQTVNLQGGAVTLLSNAIDPNTGQVLQYDWSGSDNALLNTSSDTSQFVFDPSGLDAGVYSVVLTVQDSGVPALITKARTYINVVEALAVLEAGVDSDGDGILDSVEGLSDSDGDGIPDYLDNIDRCNVLPQQRMTVDGYLVEADPGVCLRIGNFAMNGETGGSQLVDQDIDKSVLDSLTPDTEAENVGGIFDFVVTDIPAKGQVVNIVLPQRAAIPENAVYRKLKNGLWSDFTQDSANRVQSTAGEAGYCPPPESSAWTAELTAGDWCVQLSIVDGGVNDDDAEANQMVVDPGGVAVRAADPGALTGTDSQRIIVSGGGSMGLCLLVLMGIALCRRLKPQAPVVLVALCFIGFPFVAAADDSLDLTKKPRWYVSAYGGFFSDNVSTQNLQSQLSGQPHSASVVSKSADNLTFEIVMGYQISPLLSAELGYVDLGESKLILELPNGSGQVAVDDSVEVHPSSARGVAANVRIGSIQLRKISPYARLGLWRWQSDYKALSSSNVKLAMQKQSGTDWLATAGLAYMTSDNFGVLYEHGVVHFDGKTNSNIRLGLIKRL